MQSVKYLNNKNIARKTSVCIIDGIENRTDVISKYLGLLLYLDPS